MHGPVGHLRRPLVLELVQRGERKRADLRARGHVTQIARQPIPERGHPGANAGVRAVPAEQCAYLPSGLPQNTDDEWGTVWKAARDDLRHQPRELVRAAWRRQRPHILDLEVVGELVDAPGTQGMRGVRQSHSWISISVRAGGLEAPTLRGSVEVGVGGRPSRPRTALSASSASYGACPASWIP